MARVVFADTETYLSDYGTSVGLAAEMNSSDASLDFTASSSAPSTSPFEIMIFATDEEFRATARSKAGVCFYVRDTPLLGLQYFSDPSPSSCLVSAAVPAAWRQTW